MFQHRAEVAQRHSGAQQFPLITQLAGWNPDLRQSAIAQEDGESFGVERIGFVAPAHAFLGFERFSQVHVMSGPLHFIDHPVPVSGGLNGDLGFFRERVQILTERLSIVLHADWRAASAVLEQLDEDGISFMGVTAQNRFHVGHRIAAPFVAALSYDHPGAGAAEQLSVAGGKPLRNEWLSS